MGICQEGNNLDPPIAWTGWRRKRTCDRTACFVLLVICCAVVLKYTSFKKRNKLVLLVVLVLRPVDRRRRLYKEGTLQRR